MTKNFIQRFLSAHHGLALLCAILGALILALTPIFVRYSEVGPLATAFFRFFLGLPFVCIWMITDHHQAPRRNVPYTLKDFLELGTAGLFLALDIAFWYLSMIHTTVINAILLNNLCTVFVALGAWLIYKEPLTKRLAGGTALTIIGALFLLGQDFSFQATHMKGNLYALVSAVMYAGFIVTSKQLRHRFSSPTIMLWTSLVTLYPLGFLAVFFTETLIPQTGSGVLLLLGLATLVHIGGQGLLMYAMGHLSTVLASLTTLMTPVGGAILGWGLFGERLNVFQAVGAIIILAGIVVSRHNRLPKESPSEQAG